MSGKYAQLHQSEMVAGPGDARPTGLQVLQDENRFDGSLHDKVAVITGCSSGIGVPIVEALAAAGTAIYAGVRAASMDRAREALASVLVDPNTKGKVHLIELDLTSLDSVRSFAEEVKKREHQVNLLINNAGVMAMPTREVTTDGFEMQFGTNHVAHFYLFQCLKAQLLAGAEGSPDFASRVINTSSSGHRASTVDLDDINLEAEGKYNRFKAYGHSKTASIVCIPLFICRDRSSVSLRTHHPADWELPLTRLSGQLTTSNVCMVPRAYTATALCQAASRLGYRSTSKT